MMPGSARSTAQPLTSRDVARMLGVSQSMISRAFHPDTSVAPGMRARIIEAASALGYRPNVIARSLSTRSSRIIGIVMNSTDNPFYAIVLDRISKGLQQAGYQSLLFSVPPGEDADSQLPFLLQYNVDGVIIASANISSGIAGEWARLGRTAVLFNRTIPNAAVASVSCDNRAGGRRVAHYLAGLGRRRIAFVAGPRDTSTNADREAGFLAGLAECGLVLHDRAESGDYSFAAGYDAALALTRNGPDAVFFANDILALGGLDALRGPAKRRVPQDVAVVGFDDIPMAAWPAYSLTTVAQPIDDMVEAAVALVIQRGDAGQAPAARHFGGSLVVRGSTAANGDITAAV